MAEVGALALLLFCAYKRWIGNAGSLAAKSAIDNWDQWLLSRGLHSDYPRWTIGVLAPALVAALVDAGIDHLLPEFVLSFIVVYCLLPVREFLDRGSDVTVAIYNNNRDRALQCVAEWMPATAGIEDGERRLPRRLLGICALRLHYDIIGVLFWYALLGAGGAVMFFAQQRFSPRPEHIGLIGKLIERPPAFICAGLYGLAGNFAPAAREAFSGDVERAALAAGSLDGEAVELEHIPPYWQMLQRAMISAFVAAAIYLLLIY